MAIRRRPYDVPLEGAGPRFRRAFLIALGVAMVIGLLAGLVWVVAGLLNFHVLR